MGDSKAVDRKKLLKKMQELSDLSLDKVSEEHGIPKKIIKKVRKAEWKQTIDDHYPYKEKMGRDEYEEEKTNLQIELVKLQNWIQETGQKLIIVFEGRDAAGKGGTIKRFMQHLNPRGARVVALTKPSETELGQWYFQRYVKHFPTTGEMTFFDRSWYNRAGVERVMKFSTQDQYKTFISHVSDFENMIIESGTKLVKLWFSVSREEQLRRFIARANDPLKQWKLSPMDIASLGKWDAYSAAKEDMFFFTDTDHCPWIVIRSDDKKRARINAMKYVLSLYNYENKDKKVASKIDKKILGSAADIYEPDEMIHRKSLAKD